MTDGRSIPMTGPAALRREFATLVFVALLSIPQVPAQGGPAPQLTQLAAVVSGCPDDDANAERATLARLIELGAAGVPLLCDLLWSGPRADEGRPTERWTATQQRLIVSALRAAPPGTVAGHIDRLVTDERSDARTRARVLMVIEAVASADLLPTAFAVARRFTPIESRLPTTAQALSKALAATFARSPTALRSIESELNTLPRGVVSTVIDALAAAGTRRATDRLLSLLNRDESLDLEILDRLARGTRGHRPSLGVRRALETCLDHRDDRTRASAALVVAQLNEIDLIPTVIQQLEDPSTRVRANALRVLRKITGQRLDADAASWLSWWETELGWFGTDWPKLRQLLESEDAATACGALREAMLHQTFRDSISMAIIPMLFEAEAGIAALTLDVLTTLASQQAVEPLIELLEDDDPALRVLAEDALARITKLGKLGAAPAIWRAKLGID